MQQRNNSMADIREVLFQTIEAMKEGKCDIAQAETTAKLAQVIVNSRKVEVDFTKAVGGKNIRPLGTSEDDLSHRFPSRVNKQLGE